MERVRIEQILDKIKEINIAIIGDFCLDVYWDIDQEVSEFSVETGKKVKLVKEQCLSLGGAGNVALNLIDLGVKKVYNIGVVGDDPFGYEMKRLMKRKGMETSGIITQSHNWDTAVFIKPYVSDEEDRRIDLGYFNSISPETERLLVKNLENTLPSVKAVIINQQIPNGIWSDFIIEKVNKLIEKNKSIFFLVDSRDKAERFRGAIYKLNEVEAARICGMHRDINDSVSLSEAKRFIRAIFKLSKKPVYVTRGEKGVLLYDGQRIDEIPGIQILTRVDPVGAGDTCIATIAAALAAGADFLEAGMLANFASSITVTKIKQTGTASPEEILRVGANPNYIYNPELACDHRKAVFLPGTEFEIVNPNIVRGKIKYVIFDQDGTISTLRQGWQSVMENVFVKEILGDKFRTCDESTYNKVVERVRDYIDKSTGVQTIIQMEELVEMVKEFGFIPEEKILDKFGYKKIYNDDLMKLVNKRIERLKKGELDASDYTIKGAINFIDMLYKKGLKLYLASGTDREDTLFEVKTLGYAKYFKGRIYGSVSDITKYSKKLLIEEIIQENNLSGPELACFGDGPVEIRETKKHNGIAIGVASDEVRRFGLNVEKRKRLIEAGADLIIPDYSQAKKLLSYLFP